MRLISIILEILIFFSMTACSGIVLCYSKSTGRVSQCSADDLAHATRCKNDGDVSGCYIP